ncbi:MAG: superoxide dismutase family protein [Pseudomonadota bacterium]
MNQLTTSSISFTKLPREILEIPGKTDDERPIMHVFTQLVLGFAVIPLLGCSGGDTPTPKDMKSTQLDESTTMPNAPLSTFRTEVIGREGVPIGEITLTEGPHGFLMRLNVEGIEEGFHGMHFHKVGDCADHKEGFKASGAHVNPDGKAHGLLNPDGFELANLPNLYAHKDGSAQVELFVTGASVGDILDTDGFTVVIHQYEDDHKTQPIGNSGPRIGCAAFRQ